MSSPSYLVIKGTFVIVGKEPDGDSIRFIANDNDNGLYRQLQRHFRIKPSRDRSVQLRLEGIDAPEIHYGKDAQPLGAEARDALLKGMGFTSVTYAPGSTRVQSSQPQSIPGAILTKAADANGRPISYVLLENQAKGLKEGEWINVNTPLLQETRNYQLLKSGDAYYTVYTSTPFAHRHLLQEVASAARNGQKGVWAKDTTSLFTLDNQNSIGPEGQLILPKLFRRCTDYLKDLAGNKFQGNLADWLLWVSGSVSRSENDMVVVHDSLEVPLSSLIVQRNNNIAFQADLLDIVFVEK